MVVMDLLQDEVNAIHAAMFYFATATQEENGTTKKGQALFEKLEKKFALEQTIDAGIWK